MFSYFMVWWATEFGDTANIPPSVRKINVLVVNYQDIVETIIFSVYPVGEDR